MCSSDLRIPPHRDHEISMEKSKCLDLYFDDENELTMVKFEFATFLGGRFPSPDALINSWALQPLVWWQYHGSAFPTLQTLVLNFLDNLVHPLALREIGAHTNSFIP